MTKYRCLNCPDKPLFLDYASLKTHWDLTHTVPMEATIELPQALKMFFPEAVAKAVKLYEEVKESA